MPLGSIAREHEATEPIDVRDDPDHRDVFWNRRRSRWASTGSGSYCSHYHGKHGQVRRNFMHGVPFR